MKKLFSLVLVLVLALSLTACKKETANTDYVYPQISESTSKAFEVTVDEKVYSLTKNELFSTIKTEGGLSLLLEELDSELLKDVEVDQDLFKARKNKMIYGVLTDAEVNSIAAEERTEALITFNKQMAYMGFTTEEQINAYVSLLAKRDEVTKKFLVREANDPKSDYYVANSTLETYYNDYVFTSDRKAIVIDFDNQNSLRNTLKNYDLVIYNSELRKYTGTTPLADVTQSQLSLENTAVLTADEILAKFVAIYNDVYSYKTQITVANAENQANFVRNYKELSENAAALAKYIFKMNKGDYTYTTYRSSTSLGTTYSLIYALDENPKAAFAAENRADVLAKYLNDRIYQSTYQNLALNELRTEEGLKFYDKFFAYDYASNVDSSLDYSKCTGDAEILVKTKNVTIKADDFYQYALETSQARFVTLALLFKAVEKTASYSIAYGTETDLNKNASLRKLYYFDKVQSDITSNYKEETYGSEAMYLYQKYGYTNISEIILENTVTDLTAWLVKDIIISADENGVYNFNADFTAKAQDVIDTYYNNYYNLKPYVLTVYTDYDQNYVADDINDVIANPAKYGVDDAKATLINTKLAKLYNDVTSKFTAETKEEDVETVISDFVKDYNAAGMNDATFGEYKQLGFKLSYKRLSTSSSSTAAVTYQNYGYGQTDAVNASLKDLFSNIVADSTKSYYFLNEMKNDSTGSHLYVATKGDSSRIPSYKYTISESDAAKVNPGAANTEDKPSLTQVASAFNLYVYSLLADKAETAKDSYNVDEYPLTFPGSIDVSNYRSVIVSYYINDNFIYGGIAQAVASALTDATLKAKFEAVAQYYSAQLNK